jgi:hypothetical protein
MLITGLSFCCPYTCVSESYTNLIRAINDANQFYFHKYEYSLTYKSKCSTSWLELELTGSNSYQPIEIKNSNKLSLVNNQN